MLALKPMQSGPVIEFVEVLSIPSPVVLSVQLWLPLALTIPVPNSTLVTVNATANVLLMVKFAEPVSVEACPVIFPPRLRRIPTKLAAVAIRMITTTFLLLISTIPPQLLCFLFCMSLYKYLSNFFSSK